MVVCDTESDGLRELCPANGILKSAAVFFGAELDRRSPAMTNYSDEHRRSFGVEPICRTLAIAPSTYYAAKLRQRSARAVRDETLRHDIARIHRQRFSVYGVRKAWRVLRREGTEVGRDRVVG